MSPAPQQTLTRGDLIDNLRSLITELGVTGVNGRIRIVGGAAIALTIDAHRAATVDIDGPLEPSAPVLDAAQRIAVRNNRRPDWINNAAAVFIPDGYGDRTPQWDTVHDDGHVLVQVAAPETLLAMKLDAAQRRGNRDAPDLRVLLPHCDISTADAAEAVYTAYYPGDSFTARTRHLVDHLLRTSASAARSAPPLPSLG